MLKKVCDLCGKSCGEIDSFITRDARGRKLSIDIEWYNSAAPAGDRFTDADVCVKCLIALLSETNVNAIANSLPDGTREHLDRVPHRDKGDGG